MASAIVLNIILIVGIVVVVTLLIIAVFHAGFWLILALAAAVAFAAIYALLDNQPAGSAPNA